MGAFPSESTITSLMTPPSTSTAAADSADHTSTSLEVLVPVSTAAAPTAASMTAADSATPTIPTSLEVLVPVSTAAVPIFTSTTAFDSAAPTPASLEVPVPDSTAAVPTTECPTPDGDAPPTSNLPAAAASLSALDNVDASLSAKKVQTVIGKKSTRMRPGATLTARCVSAN